MKYTKQDLEAALEVEKEILKKGTPAELKSIFAAGKIIGLQSGQEPPLPTEEGKAWNTASVLAKLIEAADILLHEKNYDGHGWEQIEICHKRGLEILSLLKLNPEP
jgi:hypothetical protein